MKPRFSNQRNHALTLVEVLVVIAVLVVFAAILLPILAASKKKFARINCVNNVKEIGLAYRVWEADNGDKYPMGISVTNGGSMEMVATGNVTQTFLVMSNELSTPKILHCSEDTEHIETYSFAALASSNISYFIGTDVTNETAPQAILSGDDNFEIGGVPVKSGLLELPRNVPISWTTMRHKYGGNIGLADGSAWQTDDKSLVQKLQATGIATNRLAIP
jgi:prepilin-type N-terminal cleavage/methylation domain-containing protein